MGAVSISTVPPIYLIRSIMLNKPNFFCDTALSLVVFKSNPIPLVVPCHRVLRKNGEIGGFMGRSDKTWETNLKKQLLKLEGYQI